MSFPLMEPGTSMESERPIQTPPKHRLHARHQTVPCLHRPALLFAVLLFFISLFGKYLICSITLLGGCTCISLPSLLASLFVCFVFFASTVWALLSVRWGGEQTWMRSASDKFPFPCWADAVPYLAEPGRAWLFKQSPARSLWLPVSPLACCVCRRVNVYYLAKMCVEDVAFLQKMKHTRTFAADPRKTARSMQPVLLLSARAALARHWPSNFGYSQRC